MRFTIRTQLMLIFMTLFTLFLPGVFYWFYQFSTERMMSELRQSLVVSASTAAKMINAQEHTRVFVSGAEGDADYEKIAGALRLVRDANPRADAIYTAVESKNSNEVLFVVSADENPETRAHLREPYDAGNAPEMIKAFETPIADVEMGADEYGVWLSGYAPILDEHGKSVGIVGVDMNAGEVTQMQAQIRTVSILIFVVAYASVFLAAILISGAITKPLSKITDAAHTLENDQPYDPRPLESLAKGKDELGILAHVFNEMAEKVYKRQEVLKQEVMQLKIEIDEVKRQKQVKEIVESDYFNDLKAKSDTMRKRRPLEKKE